MNSFTTVFIGLGSNLDQPAKQIHQAVKALSELPSSQSLQCAPWYTSRAIGPGDQPDYINTVASIETLLTPEMLLDQLQTIEKQQGRQRNIRWGARTLDLDVLLYGNEIINTPRLLIPHPEMTQRGFVLQPLFDLTPNLILPKNITLIDALNNCDTTDLCLFNKTNEHSITASH